MAFGRVVLLPVVEEKEKLLTGIFGSIQNSFLGTQLSAFFIWKEVVKVGIIRCSNNKTKPSITKLSP